MPKLSPELSFEGRDFISVDQVTSPEQLDDLFRVADIMGEIVESKQRSQALDALAVSILFFQPSTRTFSSFVSAAQRLGAYTQGFNEMAQYSSAVKGEDLSDTSISIFQTTAADAIVLRHPENNSSRVAAEASPVPVINAGSGTMEHPTQALLDLYTIHAHLHQLDNLHVVMVGDLKYGRTIKSLAKLLGVAGKNNRITFVSPEELAAPPDFLEQLEEHIAYDETTDIRDVLTQGDVFYWTRIQSEWFEKEGKMDEYYAIKDKFILNPALTAQMKSDAIFMHPLPRVNEIDKEVDHDPRAKYFDQMRRGLYVRMALLERILNPQL